jgi:hypothetical protein
MITHTQTQTQARLNNYQAENTTQFATFFEYNLGVRFSEI